MTTRREPLLLLVESYFNNHLRRVRGASPHTVRAYGHALRLFFLFVAEHLRRPIHALSLDDIVVDHVLAILDHVERTRGNQPATRNCRLAAIRGFAEHLLRHDLVHAEQYQRILAVRAKRARQRAVEYLEPEHVRVLLEQPDRRRPAGLRDHALLLFLYNTGTRISEALGVTVDDLHLAPPRHVRIRGKGSKERICPLSLRVVERQKLNQVLAELQLSKSRFIDPTTAQKLGKGLAAKYILSGSYALVGDTLRIDARVFNVQTGAVLTSKKVEGKKDDFFALEKDVADLLIAALAVKLAPAERSSLRRNPTQSYDAWSAYANGLDAQDGGDVALARAAFQQALAADPNYRAARTASERLAAVFAQSAAQTEGQFDATFRDLDPKAANFNQRVDALLQSLADTRGSQYERKLSLLTWLARGASWPARRPRGRPSVGSTS